VASCAVLHAPGPAGSAALRHGGPSALACGLDRSWNGAATGVATEGESIMASNGSHSTETGTHAEQTTVELERSARQARRTLRSAAETAQAVIRDSAFAALGAGDVTLRALRELRRGAMQLPEL